MQNERKQPSAFVSLEPTYCIYPMSSIAQVKKLTYNPRNCNKIFDLEHIFSLKLYLLEAPLTNAVHEALELIGQKSKNLSDLTVNISNIEQTDLQTFEIGLSAMFRGLKV